MRGVAAIQREVGFSAHLITVSREEAKRRISPQGGCDPALPMGVAIDRDLSGYQTRYSMFSSP